MNLIFPNRIYHQKELIQIAESLADHPQDWLRDFSKAVLSWHDDKSYIEVNTSGSTGTPKTIRLSKAAMQASAQKTGKHFNLPAKTEALAALPYSFIAGKMMLIRAIVLNWNLHIVPPSANPLLHLEDEIDFVAMTPHQLSTVLTQTPSQLQYIKKILLGGAPVSPTLHKQIQHIKAEVYIGYGMTETITHIAAKRLNGPNPDSSFHALPGVKFSKTNDECLNITADHLEETISTTDVVSLIDETTFDWLGRKDNVINSGGVKIHPERVESKLQSKIDMPFFIYSAPDELLGERVIICLETDIIADNLSIQEAIGELDRYERPKEILTTAQFVYTPTGKINRKESFKKTLIS